VAAVVDVEEVEDSSPRLYYYYNRRPHRNEFPLVESIIGYITDVTVNTVVWPYFCSHYFLFSCTQTCRVFFGVRLWGYTDSNRQVVLYGPNKKKFQGRSDLIATSCYFYMYILGRGNGPISFKRLS
jgi:hypothetical protein